MQSFLKILIGLAAVMLMAWLYHGPIGNGEATIGRLEAQARAAVEQGDVPGVQVRMRRDPLARVAVLSGPANDFQREGMGQFPGLNDRVSAVEGVTAIEWANPSPAGAAGNRVMPLLLETLLAVLLAYLIGLGLGSLLFGRRKRDTYL
jgi:uncharacterized RDD family membrane protein YckC